MPNAVRRIGLGTVFALLAGTLVLGHALKAPCASGEWSDNRQYTRLCYSDNVHQLATEQLRGGRLPYLDACATPPAECDEYPVLTMWAMRAAAWISGSSTTGYFYSSAIMMWIAAFVIALCLYLLVGDRVLYFALAPTLALYATMNWDLLAVALATVGTLAYLRRKDGWSGVLLGLGAAAKIFPMLLVVPFVAGRFRGKEPDRGIRLAWAAVGDVGRGEPALRAPRARRAGGSSSATTRLASPTGTASGTSRANAPRARPARTRGWSTWRPSGCSSRGSRSCGSLKARRDPGLPEVDARVPDPGAVPADEQGLLAAVQPVAAPVVRARVPQARMVRRVRARGRGGVRHALLVVRPLPRHRRRVRGVAAWACSSSRSRSAR